MSYVVIAQVGAAGAASGASGAGGPGTSHLLGVDTRGLRGDDEVGVTMDVTHAVTHCVTIAYDSAVCCMNLRTRFW